MYFLLNYCHLWMDFIIILSEEQRFMRNSRKQWVRGDFIFQERLGVGKFGVVYKAIEKETEVEVAIKVVPKNKITTESLHKRVQRQIEIHTRLDHHNICKMFGYFHDERNLYMVIEYCKNGNLFAPVKLEKRNFSVKKVASIIQQLVSAVAYLNARHVIHRDIKLENILFDADFNVKLTDFGCCVHTTQNRSTFCGTVEYLCPEMLEQETYGPEIDFYCLGIVLYELFYHTSPYYDKNQQEIIRKIKQRQLDFPNQQQLQVPESAKSLITSLLLKKPKALTIKDILNHSFLQSQKITRQDIFSFSLPNIE